MMAARRDLKPLHSAAGGSYLCVTPVYDVNTTKTTRSAPVTADLDMSVLQIGFRVKAQPTRRSDASLDR